MKRNWTPEEIEKLQELWGVKTVPQIAEILNRSVWGVRVKSERLKLGGYVDSSEFITICHAARLLHIDEHTITRYWIKKHGLKTHKRNPYGGYIHNYLNFRELMSWLKNNQDRWDSRRVEMYAFTIEPDWLKAKREANNKSPKQGFRKWTPQEVSLLKYLYYEEGLSYMEISKKIDRSYEAIKQKMAKLMSKHIKEKSITFKKASIDHSMDE